MKILYKQWRIKTHPLSGFMVQRQVAGQWKKTTYHGSLGQAAKYLFDEEVRTASVGLDINLEDAAVAWELLNEFHESLEFIKREIVGACHA